MCSIVMLPTLFSLLLNQGTSSAKPFFVTDGCHNTQTDLTGLWHKYQGNVLEKREKSSINRCKNVMLTSALFKLLHSQLTPLTCIIVSGS